MNRTLAAAFAVCALAGCGAQSEEELISDQELSAVQSSRAAITSAEAPAPQPNAGARPAAFHLRLTWGLLGGNARAWNWINWNGGVKVDSGTATLEHLVFFDRHDFVQPSGDAAAVTWTSRTAPHFDGVVVRVQSGAASDKLHLVTASFSHDFEVAALAAGVEQRFDVGSKGHQVSVSAIPAVGCGGFAFGYQKESAEGWLGFAGLLTDEAGARQGVLRFRADDGQVRARLLGREGKVLAEGAGKLDGERFRFKLEGVGTVTGFFQPGSAFSPRGSFQASLRCE